MGTLTDEGLSLLNMLILLWKVTSTTQDQYQQAATVLHFLKTGLFVEKSCSQKCVFRNISLKLVSKSFRNTF